MSSKEDYVCLDIKDVELKDVALNQNKKIYDIRSGSKRLWLKYDAPLSIKYPFSVSPFKKTVETDKGNFVVNLSDDLYKVIKDIDAYIFEKFKEMYTGKIIDNVMMTKNTISGMIKDSAYGQTLRLNVDSRTCTFVSDDGVPLTTDPLSLLKSNENVIIVIEPTFAWVFNKQIGIHWDARRVEKSKAVAEMPRMYESDSTTSVGGDGFKLKCDSDTTDSNKRPKVKKGKKKKLTKTVQNDQWLRPDSDSEVEVVPKRKIVKKFRLEPDSD